MKLRDVVIDPNTGLVVKLRDGSEGLNIETPTTSSSKSKWENPYDKLYNLLRDINDELRTRERLERAYDRLINRRTGNANELFNNSQERLEVLKEEARLQDELIAGRKEQIDSLYSKKNSKYGKYV